MVLIFSSFSYIFEENEKISDVKINSNNQISFVKKLYTHNEVIVLSNNNYMDYNELKIKENILAYKLLQRIIQIILMI